MFQVVNTRNCNVFRICPTKEAAEAVCSAYAHLPLYFARVPEVSSAPVHA